MFLTFIPCLYPNLTKSSHGWMITSLATSQKKQCQYQQTLLPTQNFSSTLSPLIIKDCHLTASRFHSYCLTQSAIMVFKSWDEVQIGNKSLRQPKVQLLGSVVGNCTSLACLLQICCPGIRAQITEKANQRVKALKLVFA